MRSSSDCGCEPDDGQSLRRFAGWTFVLAGLAYAIAWFVLPVERAHTVATVFLASGVILVLGRVLAAMFRKRTEPHVKG